MRDKDFRYISVEEKHHPDHGGQVLMVFRYNHPTMKDDLFYDVGRFDCGIWKDRRDEMFKWPIIVVAWADFPRYEEQKTT